MRLLSTPLVKRIPFAKIATVLALTFGIALGLCGVTVFVSSSIGSRRAESLGVLELAAMILSAAGLVLTLILWVILAIVASFSQGDSNDN
jgi:hypothetical protein